MFEIQPLTSGISFSPNHGLKYWGYIPRSQIWIPFSSEPDMTTCKLSGLYVLGKIGSLAYIHILYNKHVRIIIIPMRCAVLLHVEKFIWSWNVSYRLCTILNMHSYRTFALISKVFSQTLQGRDTTSKMVCSMTLLLHTLHF